MRRRADPPADAIRTAVARYIHGMAAVETDVWPEVQARLTARRAGSAPGRPARLPRVRILGAIVLCLLLASASLSLAAAAPAARDTLVAVLGRLGMPSSSTAPSVVSLAPAPPFRVVNLGYVPPQLARQVVYYVPACSRCQTVAMATRGDALAGPDTGCDAGSANGECLLLGALARVLRDDQPAHVAELYIGFANPAGTAYVDVVERMAERGGGSDGHPRLSQRRGVTMLTVQKQGTLLALRTNLGREVALRMASSLR